jgi:hypothetical protein
MTTEGYQPNFDGDNERGKVGEEAYKEFLAGSYEVKTDYRVSETGNFYIETRQYNERHESLSGINITTADWWIEASPTGNGFIVIRTNSLKEIMRETNPREAHQPIHNSKSNASVGRLVPLEHYMQKLKFSK